MSAVEGGGVPAVSVPNAAIAPWVLLALLWTAACMTSAGRSILIVVMPQVREEFALSATQLALMNSVPFWIYAVGAFAFGRLGDHARRSSLIVAGFAFWSVATGLVSLSIGLATLVLMRSLMAAGEASFYPTSAALIGDWHRASTRSRALSLYQTGVLAGPVLGAWGAGWLADEFGWRSPFLIVASAGLVFCGALHRWLRDAPAEPSTPIAVARSEPRPIQAVLKSRPARILCLVFFLANGAATGISVWAPTFLHDRFGLDLARSAFYGFGTMSIAGILCVPLGGHLAHWFSLRTPLAACYTLATGLALAGALLLPLGFATSAFGTGLVLFASGAGKGLFDGCMYAAMHDVVPKAARATAVGLMTMLGSFGAGMTPLLVAHASQVFGMVAAMTSLALLYFVAAGLLLATRSSTRRVIVETRHTEETQTG